MLRSPTASRPEKDMCLNMIRTHNHGKLQSAATGTASIDAGTEHRIEEEINLCNGPRRSRRQMDWNYTERPKMTPLDIALEKTTISLKMCGDEKKHKEALEEYMQVIAALLDTITEIESLQKYCRLPLHGLEIEERAYAVQIPLK